MSFVANCKFTFWNHSWGQLWSSNYMLENKGATIRITKRPTGPCSYTLSKYNTNDGKWVTKDDCCIVEGPCKAQDIETFVETQKQKHYFGPYLGYYDHHFIIDARDGSEHDQGWNKNHLSLPVHSVIYCSERNKLFAAGANLDAAFLRTFCLESRQWDDIDCGILDCHTLSLGAVLDSQYLTLWIEVRTPEEYGGNKYMDYDPQFCVVDLDTSRWLRLDLDNQPTDIPVAVVCEFWSKKRMAHLVRASSKRWAPSPTKLPTVLLSLIVKFLAHRELHAFTKQLDHYEWELCELEKRIKSAFAQHHGSFIGRGQQMSWMMIAHEKEAGAAPPYI